MTTAEKESSAHIVATYQLGHGFVVPKRLLVMGEPSVSQSAQAEPAAPEAASPAESDEAPADHPVIEAE